MPLRSNMVLIMGLPLAVLLVGTMFTNADSQIKGRPTRPKEFDNAEQLKEYLDLVKEYYTLNGKARYGKRAGLLHNIVDTPGYSPEWLRSKLNVLQQFSQLMQSDMAEYKTSDGRE